MREKSGTADNVLSLPSGGGALSPLGERFQPDLFRGSGNYSIPVDLPEGPNGIKPQLSLDYSTGAGNGPFGLGWRLSPMRIERRTDSGIPTYRPGEDRFVIGDAELLIEVEGGRYRPQADTKFWDIRIHGEGWRIRFGDGREALLGQSEESREFDGAQTFAWFVEEERDQAGNTITYTYTRNEGRLFIDSIQYSIYEVRFEYEDRADILHDGRAGFPRQTAIRCRAMEIHCMRTFPTLIQKYEINYDSAAGSEISLLSSVRLTGFGEDGEEKSFPELSFDYTPFDATKRRYEIMDAEALPPPPLGTPSVQLVDMTGDGLPDVLLTHEGFHRYWQNLGDGRFGGPYRIQGVPSTLHLAQNNVALADIDGDGAADLFTTDRPFSFAFRNTGDGGWDERPIVFPGRTGIRLAGGDTRLMDLNGDGLVDLLHTGRSNLMLHYNQGEEGWSLPQSVARVHDFDTFPDVSFDNRGVRIADMTADGLQDMVFIASGRVEYWPYYGHGKWGERVQMPGSPVFPSGYREERLLLLDIDGSGCADIVYVDLDRVYYWLNQSGNGFSQMFEIPFVPGPDFTSLQAADMRGTGTRGLVWSRSARGEGKTTYRYLDFTGGVKPYLLSQIDNGLGAVTSIEYSTSTEMRMIDQQANEPWETFLPFPVQVVSTIRERDTITSLERVTSLRYHGGVYDGRNREFRGFGRTSMETNGDGSTPALRQINEFYQDADNGSDPDLIRALAGAPKKISLYEQQGDLFTLAQTAEQNWEARLEAVGPEGEVYFPFVESIETRELGDTARIEQVQFDYDVNGNQILRERDSFAEGAPESEWISTRENFTYSNVLDSWLIKLPVRSELRDIDGTVRVVQIRYYDGAPFQGLPEDEVTNGLLTRISELRLSDALLPGDYIGDRNLMEWGYYRAGSGDTAGFYIDANAYERDNKGNRIRHRQPNGEIVNITYDADALFPISVDQAGKVTATVFNPRLAGIDEIQLFDGRVIRYEYDPIGRLRAEYSTDEDDVFQLRRYFNVNFGGIEPPSTLTAICKAPGFSTEDFGDETTYETLDEVSLSRTFYDSFGNELVRVSTGPQADDGSKRWIASRLRRFNTRHLVAEEYPPFFANGLHYVDTPPVDLSSRRTRYGLVGSPMEIREPTGAREILLHEPFRVLKYDLNSTPPAGEPPFPGQTPIEEIFDARGRLIEVREPSGNGIVATTSYSLLADGRPHTVTDDLGRQLLSYTYAGPGQSIRIAHADAGNRTYYRDAAGRLRERRDNNGRRLHYTYDPQGRVIRVEAQTPGGALETVREFFYDTDPDEPDEGRNLIGRPALIREPECDLRFSYDLDGRVTHEEQILSGDPTLSLQREYDFGGRLTAVVYPDSRRIEYDRDDAGSVTDIDGVMSDIDFNASGFFVHGRFDNGTIVEREYYPSSQRLEAIRVNHGATQLREISYSYDNAGNITGLFDAIPGDRLHRTFTYDRMHRISGSEERAGASDGPIVASGEYGFDTTGNLLQNFELGERNYFYEDPAHAGRLTRYQIGAESNNVTYDSLGHVESFGDLEQLEYDVFDRLIAADLDDGRRIQFIYDGKNRRVHKRVIDGNSETTVRYVQAVYEVHDDHTVRHVILNKYRLATESVSAENVVETNYLVTDHLQSTILAIDESGTPVFQQRYTPFGLAMIPGNGSQQYLGRDADAELGLYQFGARYYSPFLGRFISPDWFVIESPHKAMPIPQAFNAYSYSANNPLILKDPSGLWFGLDDLIVAAIGFVVGFVSGLIYGLQNGQGWGSLLTALEAGALGAIGAWAGWNVGMLIGGPIGAVIGAVTVGTNAVMAGVHGIYDWGSWEGWVAFLTDYSWGIIGTALGGMVHIINAFWKDSNYQHDLSHRQNRHVYEGGMYLKNGFAFTMGNVISNAGQNGAGIDLDFIADHETLHIWQSRAFGPIFQGVYVVWGVVGFIVASVYWLFNRDESWTELVEEAAYYDNPFEYWAYKNDDNNWPPKSNDAGLLWG
jgi:RHS repeat-associated protein